MFKWIKRNLYYCIGFFFTALITILCRDFSLLVKAIIYPCLVGAIFSGYLCGIEEVKKWERENHPDWVKYKKENKNAVN